MRYILIYQTSKAKRYYGEYSSIEDVTKAHTTLMTQGDGKTKPSDITETTVIVLASK